MIHPTSQNPLSQTRFLLFVCLVAVCLLSQPTTVAAESTRHLAVLASASQAMVTPTITTTVATPAPAATPALSSYEAIYLAQQDRNWWVTVAALMATVIVAIGGWIITYLQQSRLAARQEEADARLAARQEEAASRLQASLVSVQEQLQRERALQTSKTDRLKELALYLEFPNRVAMKRDLDELQRLYETEWEDPYGYYYQLGLRFDDGSEGPPLVELIEAMDQAIDAWISDLRDGREGAAPGPKPLSTAMHLSRCALDRLDGIELRLVMGSTTKDLLRGAGKS